MVEEMCFVPVTVAREAGYKSFRLELVVRDVTVRIRGMVEVGHLRAVLAAIWE